MTDTAYARIKSKTRIRLGQVEGENTSFEIGEEKVLPLNDKVENYVDNTIGLTLVETYDNDPRTDEPENEDDEELDQEEAEDDEEFESFAEELQQVDGIGEKRAENIAEVAPDRTTLSEAVEEESPFNEKTTELVKTFLEEY